MLKWKTVLVVVAVLTGLADYSLAQQAIVRHNANLRVEPGTNDPPEAKLHVGDKLTLIDLTPEHGYYQVKTSEGKEGWVFSKSIHIVKSPSSTEPVADP